MMAWATAIAEADAWVLALLVIAVIVSIYCVGITISTDKDNS